MQKWEYSYISRKRVWKNKLISGPQPADNWEEYYAAPGLEQKISTKLIDFLNQLGDQGWELVSVSNRTDYQGEFIGGFTSSDLWMFKRPKL